MTGKQFRALVDEATHILGDVPADGSHRPGYGRYAELVGVSWRTLMRYFERGPEQKAVVILAQLIAARRVSIEFLEEAGQ